MRKIRSGEDPVLAKCEVAGMYVGETQESIIKFGDGVLKWSELPKFSSPPYLFAPPCWISVCDKLSPPDVNVIAFDRELGVVIASRYLLDDQDQSEWEWQTDAPHRKPEAVTHWIPLPEPPSEVK